MYCVGLLKQICTMCLATLTLFLANILLLHFGVEFHLASIYTGISAYAIIAILIVIRSDLVVTDLLLLLVVSNNMSVVLAIHSSFKFQYLIPFIALALTIFMIINDCLCESPHHRNRYNTIYLGYLLILLWFGTYFNYSRYYLL